MLFAFCLLILIMVVVAALFAFGPDSEDDPLSKDVDTSDNIRNW